jgi:hypothetical protein
MVGSESLHSLSAGFFVFAGFVLWLWKKSGLPTALADVFLIFPLSNGGFE